MASRMRLLPRSMKLEKSSRTSDFLWRMEELKELAKGDDRIYYVMLPMI